MGSPGAAVHWTCCAPARDAGGLGRITGGHGKPALWGSQLRDWLMILKYCLTDILLIYTMQHAKFWWSHHWISTLKMFGPLKPWKVLNFSNSTFVMFVEFWWILLNCVQFYCLGVPNFFIDLLWGADAGGWRKCWSHVQGPQHWGATSSASTEIERDSLLV